MGGLSLEARRLLLIQLCLGALLSAGFALLGDLAQAGCSIRRLHRNG